MFVTSAVSARKYSCPFSDCPVPVRDSHTHPDFAPRKARTAGVGGCGRGAGGQPPRLRQDWLFHSWWLGQAQLFERLRDAFLSLALQNAKPKACCKADAPALSLEISSTSQHCSQKCSGARPLSSSHASVFSVEIVSASRASVYHKNKYSALFSPAPGRAPQPRGPAPTPGRRRNMEC